MENVIQTLRAQPTIMRKMSFVLGTFFGWMLFLMPGMLLGIGITLLWRWIAKN